MSKYFKHLLAVMALSFLILAGCKKDNEQASAEEAVPGIDLELMDTSVRPQDDFYNYVNGTWMKTATIPDEESRWGGFMVLRKSTRKDVLDIINTAKELGTYAEGTDQKKALLIFESELDTVARTEAGIKPLQPLLEAIDGINSVSDMQTVYATTLGVSAPFMGLSSFPDLNDSSINAAYIVPGGLGLPDRDYYLEQDDKSKEKRQQYVDHITRMLQFIDYSEADAKASAERILALETQLAEPRLDKVQSRDVRNFNNPRSFEQLSAMTPAIDWNKFMDELGVEKELDMIMVMQPKYMEALQSFLNETSVDDIKTLMTWSTLNDAARYLSPEIEMANWDFYSKTLRGTKAMRPADERALGTVNGSVGEALGKLYVEAKFPPEAKEKAEKMIANVIRAFQNRIEVLDWMGEETKQKAIEKLDKFTVKIAYPDEWEDYSELQVKEENSFAENMMAVADWGLKKNLSEIG
ncbi:MAG: M13 family metallopeptidase, partial [Bacteroidia bacterium]|nr:M13 family metallopeptidase [Bacteroidia bacterium]